MTLISGTPAADRNEVLLKQQGFNTGRDMRSKDLRLHNHLGVQSIDRARRGPHDGRLRIG